MAGGDKYKVGVSYGLTDQDHLPLMPPGGNFALYYNSQYGHVDVRGNKGEKIFQGRVPIGPALSKFQKDGLTRDPDELRKGVKQYLLDSLANADRHADGELADSSDEPVMEVLRDRRFSQ